MLAFAFAYSGLLDLYLYFYCLCLLLSYSVVTPLKLVEVVGGVTLSPDIFVITHFEEGK
jgi:hypothetical protein